MPLMQKMRDYFAQLTTTEANIGIFGTTGAFIHVSSSTATFDSSINHIPAAATANGNMSSMDAAYPTRATNVLTYRATFSTTMANSEWNSIGVKSTSSSSSSTGTGILMNHLMSTTAMGTKTSSQAWQVTLANTLST